MKGMFIIIVLASLWFGLFWLTFYIGSIIDLTEKNWYTIPFVVTSVIMDGGFFIWILYLAFEKEIYKQK